MVGVDLPREKRLELPSHTSTGSAGPCARNAQATGVRGDTRVHDLGDDELVHSALDRSYLQGRRRPAAVRCRRHPPQGGDRVLPGIRHRRGLPVHGQRHPDERSYPQGRKKTVAGKKKAGRSSSRPHTAIRPPPGAGRQMPPKSRNPAPRRSSERTKERRLMGTRTSEHVQQHDRVDL